MYLDVLIFNGLLKPHVFRGGGGGVFSYIRRLCPFYLGGGGFRKIKKIWGMKILWIFFWGSSQNWTIFKGHFYAF